MAALDWQKIYKEHKGQWVALKDDELTVVGSGKTAKAALQRARTKGYEQPILAKIPPDLATYVG